MSVDISLQIDDDASFTFSRTDGRDFSRFAMDLGLFDPIVTRTMTKILTGVDRSVFELIDFGTKSNRWKRVSDMLEQVDATLAALAKHKAALATLAAKARTRAIRGAPRRLKAIGGPAGAHYFGAGLFEADLKDIQRALRKALKAGAKRAHMVVLG